MVLRPFSYFSTHNGAQWCYVENNIGYGYSTCNDQRESAKFDGETWSYHACTTPALTHSDCRYCQGRRCYPNDIGGGAPRRDHGPRIFGGTTVDKVHTEYLNLGLHMHINIVKYAKLSQKIVSRHSCKGKTKNT